jgi:hypothetical protein
VIRDWVCTSGNSGDRFLDTLFQVNARRTGTFYLTEELRFSHFRRSHNTTPLQTGKSCFLCRNKRFSGHSMKSDCNRNLTPEHRRTQQICRKVLFIPQIFL